MVVSGLVNMSVKSIIIMSHAKCGAFTKCFIQFSSKPKTIHTTRPQSHEHKLSITLNRIIVVNDCEENFTKCMFEICLLPPLKENQHEAFYRDFYVEQAFQIFLLNCYSTKYLKSIFAEKESQTFDDMSGKRCETSTLIVCKFKHTYTTMLFSTI